MGKGIEQSRSKFLGNHELEQNEKQAVWDIRFMQLAQHIGEWSRDRSRGVGCVIVGHDNDILATGYNGFPRGINDEIAERYERPLKYLWTEHAERNAIYNAAKLGIPLANSRVYLPWYPCVDCARAIVQCRVADLIALEPHWNDPQWGEHFRITRELLGEAKLSVRFLDPESLAKSAIGPE